MPESVRLPDDIRVQRHTHHQRLRARLLAHLVEVVDDHRREVLRVHLARDDHRDVVELLRIGHGPQRLAAARSHAGRLVVVAPVERVAVTGLDKQVGRHRALGNPRGQPTRGLAAAFADDAVATAFEQRALAGFAVVALSLRIAVAVADELVATQLHRAKQFGAVVVQSRVDQGPGGQTKRVEQFEASPRADAVAVFAPAMVQHIGLGGRGTDASAQTVAESEVFEVEAEVHGKAGAVWPAVVLSPGDR